MDLELEMEDNIKKGIYRRIYTEGTIQKDKRKDNRERYTESDLY